MKYPIGIQSFDQIIEGGFVYVDKTDLVYRLVTEGKIYFLGRPRRFGKTLNMSMLRYFFEMNEDNRALFEGTKIMSAGEEYLKWMGQFPVISLSLKSMKQPTFELSLEMLKQAVAEEYGRHWKLVESDPHLSDAKRERYLRIRDWKGTEADYASALKFLSECLSR